MSGNGVVMSHNAIEIRGLRKTYGAGGKAGPKTALNDVDLSIPKGSVFGLLGPNGAGKSTPINILAGLVTKTAGDVSIWGFNIDKNPRQARASIGVMPQELNLDPFFTPRGSLEVQAGLYGIPSAERQTDAILDLIGLADKADSYSRSLSGGMRRRLLLGKALVHAPAVLVLDEPTAGVDIELRQMLWENVRKLNKAGMTVILTTHYLEEAQEMCDEIAILTNGEIRIQDTTVNLLSRLDARTLLLSVKGKATPQVPPGVLADWRAPGQLALTYGSNATNVETLLDAVRSAGLSIQDIKTEQADLEDVFLDLTT